MTAGAEKAGDALVRRRYVDGPFGQIHLRFTEQVAGQTPLVCLHMSPLSGRTFEGLMADLGRDRRMIALDTPGFGMSDAPDSPPEIRDYSAAVLAALEALDICEPVDLLGYHTGSIIAVDLARFRPDAIRRLALVSAPIFTADEQKALLAEFGYEPPEVDGSHLLRRWKAFVHHFLGGGLTLEQVNDLFPERLLGRGKSWWGHRAALTYDLEHALPEVEHPVLVLNPADDLQKETWRAGPLLQQGKLVELPAWGHGFMDTSTEDAARLLRSFLDPPDNPLSRLDLPPKDDGGSVA